MAVCDAHVFPGFLIPVLTQIFFPKPPTTFSNASAEVRGEKYARKKSRLNWELNSQPPGHESNRLTTEPPDWKKITGIQAIDDTENLCKFNNNLNKCRLHHMNKKKTNGLWNPTNFRLFQTERVCR